MAEFVYHEHADEPVWYESRGFRYCAHHTYCKQARVLMTVSGISNHVPNRRCVLNRGSIKAMANRYCDTSLCNM